jgi:hypothetical protein
LNFRGRVAAYQTFAKKEFKIFAQCGDLAVDRTRGLVFHQLHHPTADMLIGNFGGIGYRFFRVIEEPEKLFEV